MYEVEGMSVMEIAEFIGEKRDRTTNMLRKAGVVLRRGNAVNNRKAKERIYDEKKG